jgi:hypothetical protein
MTSSIFERADVKAWLAEENRRESQRLRRTLEFHARLDELVDDQGMPFAEALRTVHNEFKENPK